MNFGIIEPSTAQSQVISVPMEKYEEIGRKISCQSIADQGTCKTFWWLNKQYVATGADSPGNGNGYETIEAYRVVPQVAYTGALPALTYHKHQAEVGAGRRPRGYPGIKVMDGQTTLEIVGEKVKFVGIVATRQTSLFDPL